PICGEGGLIQLLSNSNTATSYSWTGPNGFNSNLQNPAIYNSNALYTGYYTVTATDSFHCSSSIMVYVDADECGCAVDIAYNTNSNNFNLIHFTATGTPTGGNFSWNFGDGTPQQATTNTNINHLYSGIGSYTVYIDYGDINGNKC